MFTAGAGFGYLVAPSAPAQYPQQTTTPSVPSTFGAQKNDSEQPQPSDTLQLSRTDVASRLMSAVGAKDFFKRKHDIYEITQSLDLEAVKQAMEDTAKFGGYQREWVRPQLIARWLELDPEGAFVWSDQLPAGQRAPVMREFFESLALKNPAKLVAFLQRNKESKRDDDNFVMEAFSVWGTHAPADALAGTLQLDKKQQSTARYGIFRRWSQSNPQDALLALQGLPKEDQQNLGDIVFSNWADRNLPAAKDAAAALSDPTMRASALSKIIAKIGQNNREEGLQMLDGLSGDERTRVLSRISQFGYYDDPRFSAEVLLRMPASMQRGRTSQLSHQFGKLDPQAAIQWAEQLRSDDARKEALRNIVLQWGESDPKSAFDYSLKHQVTDSPFSNTAFSKWTASDPDAAWEFVQKTPESQGKQNAVRSVLSSMARNNPEKAIQLSANLTGLDRTNAMSSIATSWSYKDPNAAITWVMSLPPNEQGFPFQSVIGSWARADAQAASKWIQSQPDPAIRDSATYRFVEAVAQDAPETAMEWAKTISNENSRNSALETTLRQWKRDDPAALTAWLGKGNSIPQSVLQRVGK